MKSFISAALIFTVTSSFAQTQTAKDSVRAYSDHVYSTYKETFERAQELQTAIRNFTETPSVMTLNVARETWKFAREPYGESEVFRFYNGPIDRDGGPEGLLNSWPLDEAYIDYVAGKPTAGIINNVEEYPEINSTLLADLNELDGEKNISTGYHAIEFLLWGQDFYTDGPGQRPYTDYTTAPNADRRAEYLNVVAEMLVDDVQSLMIEWEPNKDNFRRNFETLKDTDALKKILSGVVFMAGDELGGERMYVAYETQGQEDEHSCFSDMTHMDIRWNYSGVKKVIETIKLLDYPEIKGTALAKRLEARLQSTEQSLAAIPVPFDQALTTEEGLASILNGVEELEAVSRDVAEASKLIGAGVDY